MNFEDKFQNLYHETANLSNTSREYDSKISEFVSRYGNFKNEKKFKRLEKIINDDSDERAFLALCVLHTYLRRNKKYQEIKVLETKYEEKYSSNPAFQILHLRLEINIPSMSPEESLNYAENLSKKFEDNDGVTHDFCMLVANTYEQGTESIRKEIGHNYIGRAQEIIDKVAINKYPKFLWTRARIYSILSECELEEDKRKQYYEIALKSINEAWMLEKPGEQYNTRVMTYRNYELFIKNSHMLETTRRELNAVAQQQTETLQKIKEEYNSLKTENLEILGFFVAVISFTIGSLGITREGTFIENVCSIVVLMSALLVVYGGLGIVLHGREKAGRNVVIIILGILFIGVAIISEIWFTGRMAVK